MLSSLNDFRFSTDNVQVNHVSSFKYLGVVVDENWQWKIHVTKTGALPLSVQPNLSHTR